MTYKGYIREGIRLIHRNWQLIVIRVVMSVVNCIVFFVIVGIPIFAAISALGLDISDLTGLREFLRTLENPVELIRRYLGIGLAILIAIVIYLLFAFSVWIYVFGGSIGIMFRALKTPQTEFKLSEFLKQGRRLFFPLLGYTAIISALFIAGLFVMGIIGGGITAILSIFKFYETDVGYFLRVFFAVLTGILGLALVLASVAMTFQGSAMIAINSLMPIQSFKASWRFFKERPSAFGFYAIMFSGYILINLLFFLIGMSLKFIPNVSTILTLPYRVFLSLLQDYLNLVVLGVVCVFYFSISDSSIHGQDTSPKEVPEQIPPLSE